MAYKVSTEVQTISSNTTLRQGRYGGWMAVNIGTGGCIVDGYPLAPGEGLDFTHLQPDVLWDKSIDIVCQPGGAIRVTRLIYKEVK